MKASSHCRSCGAPIRWCLTESNGRRMPVDPAAVPDGNVWVIRMDGGTPIVGVALTGDGVPANEAMRYTPHFATCPDVDSWRKKR